MALALARALTWRRRLPSLGGGVAPTVVVVAVVEGGGGVAVVGAADGVDVVECGGLSMSRSRLMLSCRCQLDTLRKRQWNRPRIRQQRKLCMSSRLPLSAYP